MAKNIVAGWSLYQCVLRRLQFRYRVSPLTIMGATLKAPFSLMCSIIPGYRDITLCFVKKGEESLHVEAWDV